MTYKDKIHEYAEELLTRKIMMDLLKDYNRPNDKINEMVKKGELTTIKKDLYVQLTPKQVVLIATPEKAICDMIINSTGIFNSRFKNEKGNVR